MSLISRRSFLSLTAGSLAARAFASLEPNSGKVVLYVSNGSTLLHYDVDVAHAALTFRSSILCPAPVQYAWPHVSRRCLYAACSDPDKGHCVVSLSVDPRTGELSKLGQPVVLPARPIHLTTDTPSNFILIAFNTPSGVRVFRTNQDLTIGDEVPEPGVTDRGIYAHQIRVTPDDRHAILVTRGVSATSTKAEDPGALKVFDYTRGVLSNEASVAPHGGIGFGPRHLDFHPTRPWVYVSLERESKLYLYKLENGRITSDAVYKTDTVADPSKIGPRQLAGAIHVHPNGRFVYVSNRNDETVDFSGSKVLVPGENSVVAYSINQATGEPTALLHTDTHKVYARTFCIDPSGRLLTAQHVIPMNVRDGKEIRMVPAGITVFRIADDGKLSYERGYDLTTNGTDQVMWGGMLPL